MRMKTKNVYLRLDLDQTSLVVEGLSKVQFEASLGDASDYALINEDIADIENQLSQQGIKVEKTTLQETDVDKERQDAHEQLARIYQLVMHNAEKKDILVALGNFEEKVFG